MSLDTADAPLCLPPAPMVRAPRAVLPNGTCDTHFHVFRPGAPLNMPRSYTPQIRTIADWRAYAKAVNIARGVLVQPSVYGFDNHVLIKALTTDPDHLRGVVVMPAETSKKEFALLDSLGVRGVRVNTRNKGGLSFSAVTDLARHIADLGWVLQFQVDPAQLGEIARLAKTLPCPVIVDHMGFVPLGSGGASHGDDLLRLVETGNCYLKLSAPYRLDKGPHFEAFAGLVRPLIAGHAQHLLWGSDWPHTELWDDMPDDADLIDLALDWIPRAEDREAIFVANPEKLFFAR